MARTNSWWRTILHPIGVIQPFAQCKSIELEMMIQNMRLRVDDKPMMRSKNSIGIYFHSTYKRCCPCCWSERSNQLNFIALAAHQDTGKHSKKYIFYKWISHYLQNWKLKKDLYFRGGQLCLLIFYGDSAIFKMNEENRSLSIISLIQLYWFWGNFRKLIIA